MKTFNYDKNNNTITLQLDACDVLNFLTIVPYLESDLENIDCPDFECNALELFNESPIMKALKESSVEAAIELNKSHR